MSTSPQPFKRIEKSLAGRSQPTTDAATSTRMSRVRQRDTSPEIRVRRAIRSIGLRYTTNNRDLPGSPDLANRTRRWAVFVHGCYWHRHEGCPKATTPRRNSEFWLEKFSRNIQRDRRAREALRRQGYKVLTIWECDAESQSELTRLLTTFALSTDYFPVRKSNAIFRAR